jgi:hypothetical protein
MAKLLAKAALAARNELCIVLSVNSVLAAGRKRRGGGMMP